MELNPKVRNLLKEDPNVWSCANCHDSNHIMIQPKLPSVLISITDDSNDESCDEGDCTEDSADIPGPSLDEEAPVSIRIDPVRIADKPVVNACLTSNNTECLPFPKFNITETVLLPKSSDVRF